MHFHFIVTGNKKRGLTDKKHGNNKNEAGSAGVRPSWCTAMLFFNFEYLIKTIYSTCYQAKKKRKKKTMWCIMSVQHQICMDIYYCCLQYSTEVLGRCEEMLWSQRARLKTETSPDWLQIYVYKLPAEFLHKLRAPWSADSLFEGNIKYRMHLDFSSPISQIETMNISVVKRFLTL